MKHSDIYKFNQVQKIRYGAKTGIFVEIQNIGTNNNLIAVEEIPTLKKIYNGVF